MAIAMRGVVGGSGAVLSAHAAMQATKLRAHGQLFIGCGMRGRREGGAEGGREGRILGEIEIEIDQGKTGAAYTRMEYLQDQLQEQRNE